MMVAIEAARGHASGHERLDQDRLLSREQCPDSGGCGFQPQ
jgi:hypothetical protein